MAKSVEQGARGDVIGGVMRRFTTAAVLLHHALAEGIGLGPTDHKCLDLLRERGSLTASQLAGITGLTTGAVTGVVARLEAAGFVRREPDPTDGRKQNLFPSEERAADIHAQLGPIRADMAELLDGFDPHQVQGITEFLARATELTYRHIALLRARVHLAPGGR
jgi:DNA-binding MarR family transcriptional regulator